MVTVIKAYKYYKTIFDLFKYNLSKGHKCYIFTPDVINDYDFYFQLVKDDYTEEEYRDLGRIRDEHDKVAEKYHFKNAFTSCRCREFKVMYNYIKDQVDKNSKVFITNAGNIDGIDYTKLDQLPHDIYVGYFKSYQLNKEIEP